MGYVKKKAGSKQEIAYQRIKDAILNNEFEPDTMLIEGVLCEKLGFSKTPIREALRRLASEKFVEFIPEKGTFVSRIGLDDFIEIYDVREALEGMAARLCVQRKDEKFIELLGNILNNIYIDLTRGKNVQNVKEDMLFHNTIIAGSKNSNLISFSKTLLDQINRFAKTTINDVDRLQLSYKEHKNVFDAIISNDGDAAERAIREHIRSVKEYQIKKHFMI